MMVLSVVKLLTVGLSLVSLTCQKVLTGFEGNEQIPKGMSKDPNYIEFYLYPNPANPTDADELKYGDVESVRKSRYDPLKTLIVYSSGFYQNRTTDQTIKDAYLSAGFATDFNIVVIEWGKLSGNQAEVSSSDLSSDLSIVPAYMAASNNVAVVGKRTQEFLTFLIHNGFLAGPESVHCVGMSLGSHVCGKTGFYYKEVTGELLRRVTGLDSAGPLFWGFSKEKRLDAGDAAFVVTVHTDDWKYGYAGDHGRADFYVNGGKGIQPGCEGSTNGFCSHFTATKYYARSIHDKSLLAYDCKFCGGNAVPNMPFGENCPSSAHGSYYIDI